MATSKGDIIAQLRREILSLQGFKNNRSLLTDMGLGPIGAAFPNAIFPTGAVHEFITKAAEQTAATYGFTSALIGNLMKNEGACIWVSLHKNIFPPALSLYGIDAGRVVFIQVRNQRDALWAMEEALKCEGLAAVVGEIKELSFTESRRLQLAVEQSRVTGLVIRHAPRRLENNACIARWQIDPLKSYQEDKLPGVGFASWQVNLLRVRNGKPGSWRLHYEAGRFLFEEKESVAPILSKPLTRKTG